MWYLVFKIGSTISNSILANDTCLWPPGAGPDSHLCISSSPSPLSLRAEPRSSSPVPCFGKMEALHFSQAPCVSHLCAPPRAVSLYKMLDFLSSCANFIQSLSQPECPSPTKPFPDRYISILGTDCVCTHISNSAYPLRTDCFRLFHLFSSHCEHGDGLSAVP